MLDTAALKKFAQKARNDLLEQIESRLNAVLRPGAPERASHPAAIGDLEKDLLTIGRAQVIDRAAYAWFNRLCALRYMDLARYSSIGIASPQEGQIQPEILAIAKTGDIDPAIVPDAGRRQLIMDMLEGKTDSLEPQRGTPMPSCSSPPAPSGQSRPKKSGPEKDRRPGKSLEGNRQI